MNMMPGEKGPRPYRASSKPPFAPGIMNMEKILRMQNRLFYLSLLQDWRKRDENSRKDEGQRW